MWWTIGLLFIFFIGSFSLWIRNQKDIDIDNKIKIWEVFTKLLSVIIAIAAAVTGFSQYLAQQDRALQQSRIELLQRQIEVAQKKQDNEIRSLNELQALYDEATKLTISFSHTPIASSPEFRKNFSHFDELYYAKLVTHGEGPYVEDAMVRFRQALVDWQETESKPVNLNSLSLKLSDACRNELRAKRKQIDALDSLWKVQADGLAKQLYQ